jgi:hypothetical protein
MKRRSLRRLAASVGAAAAMLVAGGFFATAAHASGIDHYYVEIGGTGAAQPASKGCTSSYWAANATLPAGSKAVGVCYPATAGPWVGGVTAPSYDASVHQGYGAALALVKQLHAQNPGARITITGYSQGAQIGDQVLQAVAAGSFVPHGQVDGMLYADPMQPGTGIWGHLFPKGVSLLGFTSTGAGPTDFDGIPVRRFCIRTDGICDATSIQGIGGYFVQHPTYPKHIIGDTLRFDGQNGIRWYPEGAGN